MSKVESGGMLEVGMVEFKAGRQYVAQLAGCTGAFQPTTKILHTNEHK